MGYRIDFLKDGKSVSSIPGGGSVEDAKRLAREDLSRHDANFARIVDELSGAEVDSVSDADRA